MNSLASHFSYIQMYKLDLFRLWDDLWDESLFEWDLEPRPF